MYAARFASVLAFHAPGLAAAEDETGAFHIREDGRPAYARRFRRSFGFYEGLAAVDAGDGGWFHIRPSAEAAYERRFAWCGNYQGGRCPVRDERGAYFHLTLPGVPAYEERWRYAGDYRHGVAVVQGDDGKSTHIDQHGAPLHGVWFLDLDVFHKGFARAMDDRGWMHVDGEGRPAYARRFAMVEPFYNGQARVETHEGALQVIDETGETLAQLRPPLVSPLHALSSDLVGHWRTDVLAAAVRLRVPEALPGDSAAVADRVGVPSAAAERLLRALWELRVVEPVDGMWRLTAKGKPLRLDHPQTLADAALEYAGPLREPWSRLDHILREPGWRPDVFEAVANDPARREGHHRMLRSYALEDYATLVDDLPIQAGDTVLDVGGGSGALAAMVEQRTSTPVTVLELAGVPVAEGLKSIEADFFEPWPVRADVVLLGRVLHDWDDADAKRILTRCREALHPGGQLCVLEMIRPSTGPGGSLCDLHLLAVTGGRERTLEEWTALLADGGFLLEGVVDGSGIVSLLVAT